MTSYPITLGEKVLMEGVPKILEIEKSKKVLLIARELSLVFWDCKKGRKLLEFGTPMRDLGKIESIIVGKISENRKIIVGIGGSTGNIVIFVICLRNREIKRYFLIGHENKLISLDFFPDQNVLISMGQDGKILLWNLRSMQGKICTKNYELTVCKKLKIFSPKLGLSENYYVLGMENCSFSIWNMFSGKCEKKLKVKSVYFLDFFFDGKTLYLMVLDQNLCIYHYNFNKNMEIHCRTKTSLDLIIRETPEHFMVFSQNLFLKTKNRILVLDELKLLKKKYKKIDDQKRISRLKNPIDFPGFFLERKNFPTSVGLFIDHSNSDVYIISQQKRKVSVWEYRFQEQENLKQNYPEILKLAEVRLKTHSGGIKKIIWSKSDFSIISISGSSFKLKKWDLGSKKYISSLLKKNMPVEIKILKTDWVMVGFDSGSMECFDIELNQSIWAKAAAHNGPLWAITQSDKIGCIISGGSDGKIKLWEIKNSNIEIKKIINIEEPVIDLKILEKCKKLLSRGLTSIIYLFEINSLKLSCLLKSKIEPLLSLSIGDDDDSLITGGTLGNILIWSIKSSTKLRRINVSSFDITSIEHLHQTKNFLIGDKNGKIGLWKGDSLILICEFVNFHTSSIWAISSSDMGDFFATGSKDEKLLIWKISNLNRIQVSGNFFPKKNLKRSSRLKPKIISADKRNENLLPLKFSGDETRKMVVRSLKNSISKKNFSKKGSFRYQKSLSKKDFFGIFIEFIKNFLNRPINTLIHNQKILLEVSKILNQQKLEERKGEISSLKTFLLKICILFLQKAKVSRSIVIRICSKKR